MKKQNTIAEVQVSYSHIVKPSLQPTFTGSQDAYRHLISIWKDVEYRESFAVLLLSRSNKFLGISWIGTGGSSGVVVDVKLIFQRALLTHSSSLILAHNHPSGTLKPSEPDMKITRKLIEGGKLLDINVLDHIILTSESYLSMADDGLL